MQHRDALALARQWCAEWAGNVEPLLVQSEFMPALVRALEADALREHSESGFIVRLQEPFEFKGKPVAELRVYYPAWKPWQIKIIEHAQRRGDRAGARASLAMMNGLPPLAGDSLGEFDLNLLGMVSTFVFNMHMQGRQENGRFDNKNNFPGAR